MTSTSTAAAITTIAFVLISAGSLTARADDDATTTTITNNNRTDIQATILAPASYCGTQVLAPKHRYRVFEVRSKAECAVQCGRERDCVSIVYDKGSGECHLGDAKADSNCGNMVDAEAHTTFYQETLRSSPPPSPCEDGKVMGSEGTCVCPPGHSGTPCKKGYQDCQAILESNKKVPEGLYDVHPVKHPEPFKVYCRNVNFMRMYVMRRMKVKKNLNFDRSWKEYKDGFGDLNTDFWLGLDKLHALTAGRDYKLRISVILANGSNIDITYHNFKIGDASSGYRLQFNTSVLYYTQQNDCFFSLLNAKFSVAEHDVDNNPNFNCADWRKSGFWFHGPECSRCNPHGKFYQRADKQLEGEPDEVFWDSIGSVPPIKLNMALVNY